MATVTTEQELRDAIAAREPSVFIANDLDITNGFVIDYALAIDSENRLLRWNGAFGIRSLLRVNESGRLTLTNITLDGMLRNYVTLVEVLGGICTLGGGAVLRNVHCTGVSYALLIGSIDQPGLGGRCDMVGALITETTGSDAVFIHDGELNMGTGARIAHTNSRGLGMIRGTLNMRADAAIEYNTHTSDVAGGLIAVNGSVVNMGLEAGDAPRITGNRAVEYQAGGVYIAAESVLNMRFGAAIRDNHSPMLGGGVTLQQASLNMWDDAIIEGNEAAQVGGGVFAMDESSIRMFGRASIANNRASGEPGRGGGVYMRQQGTVMRLSDSASITGNTAAGDGGGVYAAEDAEITLEGDARVGDNGAMNILLLPAVNGIMPPSSGGNGNA